MNRPELSKLRTNLSSERIDMYQQLSKLGKRYFPNSAHKLFKFMFNLSPMYRRSTGRVTNVTEGFWKVDIKIPISYKNRNYAGTIFGGSLFSATDPIFMVQLVQIIGSAYIVWDKSSVVKFKRPANQDVFASFAFEEEEVAEIKRQVASKGEVELVKPVQITNIEGTVFCQIDKTIYVADKQFYKNKLRQKRAYIE